MRDSYKTVYCMFTNLSRTAHQPQIMPRTTRAAARAQESDTAPQLIYEDGNTATDDLSPTATNPARPIFGELVGNNVPTSEPNEQTVIIYAMPATKAKGRKGRPATKKNKLNLKVQTENEDCMMTEVLEDDDQSDSTDAADAAAEELRKDERPSETFQVPVDVKRPRSPPSAAVKEAMSTLLRSPNKATVAMPPNTPKFDPAAHKKELQAGAFNEEDSFVEDITARSPSKGTLHSEENKEDSFVEAIITRSPTKATPRIEDSVAEMDALDDAIEEVAEILPILEERNFESPIAIRGVVNEAATPSLKRKTALTTTLVTKSAAEPPKVRPSLSKASTRPSASRPATVRVKPTARASVLPSQQRAVSADTSSSSLDRPSLSFSASQAKPQPNTTQKIRKSSATNSLSTSKPGFVPAKSTKATTTSTFVLPGAAISAKLKVQREERQKREEEAAGKEAAKKVVAKPATAARARTRLSTTVAPTIKPRETKTSQARQSLVTATNEKRSASGTSSDGKVAPIKVTKQQSTKSPPVNTKALAARKKPVSSGPAAATNVQKTRTPMKQAKTDDAGSVRANSAIRRSGTGTLTKAVRKDSIAPSPSSGSDAGVKKPSMNNADLVSQKGKEVFGRHKIQNAEADRARREKEEAAKKARAEAAERGRIASREWAERQKKKATVAEAAKKEQVQVSAIDGGGAAVMEAAGV